MDPIIALLAELGFEVGEAQSVTDLTDEQLTAAQDALTAAFADAREARDVERAELLADQIDAVRAEDTRRTEVAEAAEARLAELDQRVNAEPEAADETETVDESAAEVEAPAAETAEEPAEVAEPIAAGAETAPALAAAPVARRMPRAPARRVVANPAAPTARGTIVAAGGLPGLDQRRPLRAIRELGDAVAQRVDSARKGGGGYIPVARVSVEFPAERTLDSNATENMEKHEAVLASLSYDTPEAIVAAGGLCAPLPVRYDVDGISDDRRPIRDGLVRYGADRGGVRGVRPPVLTDLAGAVDIITEAEDAASASKPCLTVSCGAEYEEVVDAVTKCLQIGNFARRTFAENFNRYWQLAGAQHAREAETRLWDRMVALSTAITAPQVVGFFRDFVEHHVQLAAGIRSRDRTAENLPVRVIAPDWVVPMAGIDLLRQMPGDQTYEVGEAELRRALAVHNIVLSLTPDTDQEFPAQPANNVIMGWPMSVETLTFPDGTFAFLDGGELNFGMEIRDSTLNAANNVRSMTETFEGVAMFGVRSYHSTITVCPNGTSIGTVDDPGICTGQLRAS